MPSIPLTDASGQRGSNHGRYEPSDGYVAVACGVATHWPGKARERPSAAATRFPRTRRSPHAPVAGAGGERVERGRGGGAGSASGVHHHGRAATSACRLGGRLELPVAEAADGRHG